jgi:oligopeptide/dipeptide ABC transporter ATP-binding protein
MSDSLLEVQDLSISFPMDEGLLEAVRSISFSIPRGKTLGIVGESGCGKSVTAPSLLRLLPKTALVGGQSVLSAAEHPTVDLNSLALDGDEIRAIRGRDISIIFQEPMTSLSPLYTVGNQIVESILLHYSPDPDIAKERAIEMLAKVGIPNARQRFDNYPFEMSGGMRQRVMIAMALSASPALLIADEPTTALDVTIQAQVLDLMRELQQEIGMSILFITHDLGVVAQMCDEVAVMYLGRIVERADVKTIFERPRHPYTIGLLNSIPKLGQANAGRIVPIDGTVPVPINVPKACSFAARCPHAMTGLCDSYDPPLVELESGESVACFLYEPVRDAIDREPMPVGTSTVGASPIGASPDSSDSQGADHE